MLCMGTCNSGLFSAKQDSAVWVYHNLFHWGMILGYLQFGAIMNDAAMNIHFIGTHTFAFLALLSFFHHRTRP